jgi:DNA ligase-1
MKDLETFYEFASKMVESNSRKHKLAVMEEYSNNEAVRYFLWYVHNPYVVTGISKRKLLKDISQRDTEITTAHQLLDWLSINNTGKDEAIAKVHGFEEEYLDGALIEVLERIICKDLPLGVDTLTVNKVMPGLIPTFDIMLANKYFDKPEIVEGREFTITTKIDGGRILAVKRNGEVTFYTRAGQVYEGLVDIQKELEEIIPDNFVLDGEITLLDSEGLDNKEQYKRTMMITRRDGEKHGVKILAFDFLPVESFDAKKTELPYKIRRSTLETMFSGLKFVTILPALYCGSDTNMIGKLLKEQTSKGEEGIMINLNDEPYAFKRGSALLKVKKMQDIDLKIIRLEEGTNQNRGKLGAFVVDYEGNEVKVGSGINKETREKVWNNPDEYIGLTISVQYFEETKNQQGGKSLRFPVFLDFRYDK